MTYEETLHYLYTSIPVYQHSGASAYKPGLQTSIALDDHLGNPHKSYKSIHVAGTNGKGSVSHLLAAILSQSGHTVGLYTSPHLLDFRERIRVDGEMIPQAYVIDFVERHRSFFEPLKPSFFELTSSMAFEYFRDKKVDYAIIEVGLGGRLDSTNIISPILSVITNISRDHTQFLGDTVEQIAAEKAGIIKRNTPALVGEIEKNSVLEVFQDKAAEESASLYLAQEMGMLEGDCQLRESGVWHFPSTEYGGIVGELGGKVQSANAMTVLSAVHLLRSKLGVRILPEAIHDGFGRVVELTGLMGRWQKLHDKPTVICDTGHNIGGWEPLSTHLSLIRKYYHNLHMIVGMVNDKDIDGVLSLMPADAFYYFTRASVERAMPAEQFAAKAMSKGLNGIVCGTVEDAIEKAMSHSDGKDLIFIGGSTFIVADAIPLFKNEEKENKTIQKRLL